MILQRNDGRIEAKSAHGTALRTRIVRFAILDSGEDAPEVVDRQRHQRVPCCIVAAIYTTRHDTVIFVRDDAEHNSINGRVKAEMNRSVNIVSRVV